MLECAVKLALENHDVPQIEAHYEKSFDIISNMLTIPESSGTIWNSRSFDHERLSWEMKFFFQQTLRRIESRLPSSFKKQFEQESDQLAVTLGARARYFVHRDFHSRNLMLLGETLAVIDFQDARLGAPSYDLVSLVFDPYVNLSESCRSKLLQSCFEFLDGRIDAITLDEIKREWPLVLIQRQLKAIGSYGFLTFDKSRGNYLKYVRPAIAAVRGVVANQSERFPLLAAEIWDILEDWVNVEEGRATH